MRGKEMAAKNIQDLDRLLAAGELSEADHAREKALALSKLSAQEVDLQRLLTERRPAVPPPTPSPGWVQETRLSDEEVAFFVEHGCEHVPWPSAAPALLTVRRNSRPHQEELHGPGALRGGARRSLGRQRVLAAQARRPGELGRALRGRGRERAAHALRERPLGQPLVLW